MATTTTTIPVQLQQQQLHLAVTVLQLQQLQAQVKLKSPLLTKSIGQMVGQANLSMQVAAVKACTFVSSEQLLPIESIEWRLDNCNLCTRVQQLVCTLSYNNAHAYDTANFAFTAGGYDGYFKHGHGGSAAAASAAASSGTICSVVLLIPVWV